METTIFVNSAQTRRSRSTLAALLVGLMLTTAACSSPEQRVEKFTASGQAFLEEADYGRANVQFQNALKINEDHVPALLGVAAIAEEKKDFQNLFGILQKIIRLDPQQADAQIKIAKLYLIGGDEAAALESAEAALALVPESADALAVKAAVLLKLENTSEAVEYAKRALAIAPANSEAVAVVATERAQAGDNEAALAEIERALGLDRDVPVLHLLRIQLLANMGRTDDLLAAHREVIDVYPEEVAYRQIYVRSLVASGDLAGARAQLEEIARLSPGNVDAMLDVVRIDNRIGGTAAAGATFRKFVDANPDNVDLKFRFADFLRGEKDFAGAEAIYAAFASEKDQSLAFRAKNQIAGLRLLEGKIDEGKAIVDEILAADPRNTEALIKRASLKIEAGDNDGAILDLRVAIEDQPDSTPAKVLMATAFERKGDIEFAKSQMAQAVVDSKNDPNASNLFAKLLMRTGDVERAEQVLNDSLAIAPNDVENLKLLGAVRLMRQDWRGAEEAAKRLEAVSAEDPVANRLLGAAYTGLEDYKGAIEALSAAQARAPLGDRPLATLVSAYVKDGRAEEAAEMLRGMIEREPDNYAARYILAQTLFTQQKNDEGIDALRAAIRSAPDRVEAPDLLYRVLIVSSRAEEAGAMLDEVLAAAPDNLGARILKADYLLTTGRQEEAMAAYADVLERRPGDLLASNNYASLLSDLRDDPASRAKAADVAKVLEGNANPYFLDTLGWAQVRNGALAEGIANLEKAVAGSTGFADAHYHLGAAYLEAGEVEKARAELEKAVSAGGTRPIAERARELLSQN